MTTEYSDNDIVAVIDWSSVTASVEVAYIASQSVIFSLVDLRIE
jgi:hypothetical protein